MSASGPAAGWGVPGAYCILWLSPLNKQPALHRCQHGDGGEMDRIGDEKGWKGGQLLRRLTLSRV